MSSNSRSVTDHSLWLMLTVSPGRERQRVHELALLDAGRVHLDPFEVQVPDRLDRHPRLEAGGGALQRGVVEVDGEYVLQSG